MKINFKYIFIGAIIVIAFILGKSCQSDCPEVIGQSIESKRDTIWQDTGSYHKPQIIHDTFTILQGYVLPKDSLNNIDTNAIKDMLMLRSYQRTYYDSLIEIEVNNLVMGQKLAENLQYRLRKNFIIHDSIFTTNTIEGPIKAPKYVLNVGADFTPKNLYLVGQLGIKRNNFDLGYDPFNKQFKIGYKYTIFRSKK